MTDFNLAEAEKLANDYDNPADFLDMRDTLCSAIAHIRKLEAVRDAALPFSEEKYCSGFHDCPGCALKGTLAALETP